MATSGGQEARGRRAGGGGFGHGAPDTPPASPIATRATATLHAIAT